MILALLLRVEIPPGDVRLAMGIIRVLAVFLEMILFAWIARTAKPKPLPVAKLTVRTSCAQ
ncbi:hypothetical protein [Bradyrhizobium sp. C9]|uniref:hypothetical protein n=1 Tax=Bradyrhizobium sp. C9 TaxID=142585 RepID=UPI000BE79C76|nr:hypothetical protein [Bradyrhizobium sp. C9]